MLACKFLITDLSLLVANLITDVIIGTLYPKLIYTRIYISIKGLKYVHNEVHTFNDVH